MTHKLSVAIPALELVFPKDCYTVEVVEQYINNLNELSKLCREDWLRVCFSSKFKETLFALQKPPIFVSFEDLLNDSNLNEKYTANDLSLNANNLLRQHTLEDEKNYFRKDYN